MDWTRTTSNRLEADADAAVSEAAGKYLSGMLPELNLRLFCETVLESGSLSQRILWVEEIEVLPEEKKNTAFENKEKYCPGKWHFREGKAAAFAGQIKYMAEKIKNRFQTLWKKKGR